MADHNELRCGFGGTIITSREKDSRAVANSGNDPWPRLTRSSVSSGGIALITFFCVLRTCDSKNVM